MAKCIVKGCENHKEQGTFIGDVCAPCYEMLTTGKVKDGNTFIHQLQKNVEYSNILRNIDSIKAEYYALYNLKINTIYVGKKEFATLCTFFNGKVTIYNGLNVIQVNKESYLSGGIF